MTTISRAAKASFYLLLLDHIPIFQQLQIEEALLRADKRNWCILNSGTPPAIVMGISGKPDLLINHERLKEKPVPVIKRFSGGGTVFVDQQTVFATWICNTDELEIACCPLEVHRWSAEFYQTAFPHLNMSLVENDYVIGSRKFGGNAQYLCRGRWLHHSSLLWDFNSENMQYLLMPNKIPHYRQQRSHDDFLCRLCEHFPDKKSVELQILNTLDQRFHVKEIMVEDILPLTFGSHRKATFIVN